MPRTISALQKARAAYQPKLPAALSAGNIRIEQGKPTEPATDREEIKKLFPSTYGQPVVKLIQGESNLNTAPLKVGVVLSGGQAPGGHNVIAGLYDALKSANSESILYGFLKGPIGVIKGKYRELTADAISEYRNTGGFDMIMSGRDKIEKPEDLAACKKNIEDMGLDGLVIIGGDDSNTNAAVLAEYLKASGCSASVIGVPKTIDGDMKNEQIETSFGFDTCAKTYSELIGNIARDATSAIKYWHFIRLMGRAASHVALECGLQTQPNITLISEEVAAKGTTLSEIVDYITDIVVKRAAEGKNYGVLLVPEGLVEFISDIKRMIDELSTVLGQDEQTLRDMPSHDERIQHITRRLSAASADVYESLPSAIREVLLSRDSHGNVPVSQIETERLLMELVSEKIRVLKAEGKTDAKFSPLSHFFGYEGRCAAPSNYDADYCYSLGYAAAQLVRAGLTGYTVNMQGTVKSANEWAAGATPVTMMLNMEIRKGKPTPVIKKALVDLNGKPFAMLAKNRDEWAVNDCYIFPGPIQYFGPSEVCDQPTKTLALEKSL
jgi:pyrophosphate--fructose-6-phosphate 1-phosphotransferase